MKKQQLGQSGIYSQCTVSLCIARVSLGSLMAAGVMQALQSHCFCPRPASRYLEMLLPQSLRLQTQGKKQLLFLYFKAWYFQGSYSHFNTEKRVAGLGLTVSEFQKKQSNRDIWRSQQAFPNAQLHRTRARAMSGSHLQCAPEIPQYSSSWK